MLQSMKCCMKFEDVQLVTGQFTLGTKGYIYCLDYIGSNYIIIIFILPLVYVLCTRRCAGCPGI